MAEGPRHFLRRFEIKLIGGKAEAIGVGHGLAGLDAEQHFVGLGLVLIKIVTVIGGHQGQIKFGGELF